MSLQTEMSVVRYIGPTTSHAPFMTRYISKLRIMLMKYSELQCRVCVVYLVDYISKCFMLVNCNSNAIGSTCLDLDQVLDEKEVYRFTYLLNFPLIDIIA